MGYVYLIKDISNRSYKIGVTRENVEKRIKKLQTGNSSELKLEFLYETEYPFRMESMLHAKYKDKQTLNEWYELSDSEVNEFPGICKLFNENIDALKNNPFFNKGLR